jgi:hypothetical protein
MFLDIYFMFIYEPEVHGRLCGFSNHNIRKKNLDFIQQLMAFVAWGNLDMKDNLFMVKLITFNSDCRKHYDWKKRS